MTTFELFFDLVYVFALTQVTAYMAHAHTGAGVLQGMLLLALLWWSWSAYAWLGNQARVDLGIVRAGMGLAMVGVFVAALALPEAWHDAPGGLAGPLVLTGAYLFVRCVHLVVYGLLARGDRALRRQVAIDPELTAESERAIQVMRAAAAEVTAPENADDLTLTAVAVAQGFALLSADSGLAAGAGVDRMADCARAAGTTLARSAASAAI
ncbi:low temperature requirement protein A [Streptomyces mirabilis]|uniref:low temperature requirement protein A n=1 Tax=Streptomyces sp. NPDC005388 TaxID=3156717 RepID=UPI0033AFE9D2